MKVPYLGSRRYFRWYSDSKRMRCDPQFWLPQLILENPQEPWHSAGKNLSRLQIPKFGDIMRRYFFINKRLGNKWRVPLDSPHRKDLRKNLKSEFHGLAELSTGNTYDKQMSKTQQISNLKPNGHQIRVQRIFLLIVACLIINNSSNQQFKG